MAAYPETYISRQSRANPDARILSDFADDGTIKFRQMASATQYAVTLVHEWLTSAEYAAILAFITTNGYGPHTFTLAGHNYSGTLINEPAITDRRGNHVTVEAKFLATRV